MSVQPNLEKIELIADVLGDLRGQLVFVGGCAVDLLLTDTAAAPARVTFDVDLVARVDVLSAYHALEARFAALGFKRDMARDAPICRWRYRNLEVDLMPMDAAVLGFANRWYPLVVQTASDVALPSGLTVRMISAPAFIATKFEAFRDRGKGDVLGSHDLEDIINVIDGRPELLAEIAMADPVLRQYLGEQCRVLMGASRFVDSLPGMIQPDEMLADRVRLLKSRLDRIAAM